MRAAVEAEYAHLSYNQRKTKLAELQAFLARIAAADILVTTAMPEWAHSGVAAGAGGGAQGEKVARWRVGPVTIL